MFLESEIWRLTVPPPPDPQLSGTIGTKITLTSNTGECHNFLVHGIREGHNQARRKHFGSGAAIGTKKTAGGLGQSPGGDPGGEAPGSSVNLGILKP